MRWNRSILNDPAPAFRWPQAHVVHLDGTFMHRAE
jgi:hypothetical protein